MLDEKKATLYEAAYEAAFYQAGFFTGHMQKVRNLSLFIALGGAILTGLMYNNGFFTRDRGISSILNGQFEQGIGLFALSDNSIKIGLYRKRLTPKETDLVATNGDFFASEVRRYDAVVYLSVKEGSSNELTAWVGTFDRSALAHYYPPFGSYPEKLPPSDRESISRFTKVRRAVIVNKIVGKFALGETIQFEIRNDPAARPNAQLMESPVAFQFRASAQILGHEKYEFLSTKPALQCSMEENLSIWGIVEAQKEELTQVERHFRAAIALHYEFHNSGIDGWFYNSASSYVNSGAAAFRAIGSPCLTGVLERLVSLLPDQRMPDSYEAASALLEDVDHVQLDGLEKAVMRCRDSDDIDLLLFSYARSNRDAIRLPEVRYDKLKGCDQW